MTQREENLESQISRCCSILAILLSPGLAKLSGFQSVSTSVMLNCFELGVGQQGLDFDLLKKTLSASGLTSRSCQGSTSLAANVAWPCPKRDRDLCDPDEGRQEA